MFSYEFWRLEFFKRPQRKFACCFLKASISVVMTLISGIRICELSYGFELDHHGKIELYTSSKF